jgi:hypothetical protein
MYDLDALMKEYGDAGGDKAILKNNEIAHLLQTAINPEHEKYCRP